MPEVLEEYHKHGANLDLRGATSIEVTVFNKSYNSFKYLLDPGYRPSEEKLKEVDSRSVTHLYNEFHPNFILVIIVLLYFIFI